MEAHPGAQSVPVAAQPVGPWLVRFNLNGHVFHQLTNALPGEIEAADALVRTHRPYERQPGSLLASQ